MGSVPTLNSLFFVYNKTVWRIYAYILLLPHPHPRIWAPLEVPRSGGGVFHLREKSFDLPRIELAPLEREARALTTLPRPSH